MGITVTIYHNPRCSKSRQTLALLRERGFEPEIIEYMKTPPEHQELKRIIDRLGLKVREVMRTGEAEFRENGLDDKTLDDDALIQAMCQHPRLIQRPIIIVDERARIGRPPESVIEILP